MTDYQLHKVQQRRGETAWRSRLSFDAIKLLARQAYVTALDLVFPPQCVHCQRVGSFLCARCLERLETAPVRIVEGVEDVRVATTFEGAARSAIHALKYDGVKRLAGPLASLMAGALIAADWPVDLVIAVPLHQRRLQERGYNQSALLARELALKMGWRYEEGAVSRVRETETQTHLNAQQRRQNVAGAFVADPTRVANRCVVVVDDVLTTGATLTACAEALHAAGARRVYGVALASAVFAGGDAGVPDTLALR